VLKVEAIDRTDRPVNHLGPDWLLAYCTGALAMITGGLALYTYRLYRTTVELGRDAKQTATEQTDRMERSVVEAGRAATAMEAVALATNNNAALMQPLLKKQMRAYLAIDLGTAVCQNAKLRFEVHPLVANYGLTPARNVRLKVLTAIIDGSHKEDIALPEIGEMIISDVGIAPRQSFGMSVVLDHRLPDAEVEAIMVGITNRLFAFGKVYYDDVYGDSWETNFCINYTFPKFDDGTIKVNSYYYRRHNSAT
jgi:uncharacterized protein (UPF0212 family)